MSYQVQFKGGVYCIHRYSSTRIFSLNVPAPKTDCRYSNPSLFEVSCLTQNLAGFNIQKFKIFKILNTNNKLCPEHTLNSNLNTPQLILGFVLTIGTASICHIMMYVLLMFPCLFAWCRALTSFTRCLVGITLL